MALQHPVELAIENGKRPVLAMNDLSIRVALAGHGSSADLGLSIRLRKRPARGLLAFDPFPVGLQILRETLAAADPSVK
jgi:hypothetical protein